MSKNEKRQDLSVAGKKKPNIAMVIIGMAIVVLLIIIAVILVKSNSEKNTLQTDEPNKREVLVNESNVSEVAQQLEEAAQEHVLPGQYTATMNFEWHFATGDAESKNAYVANSTENTNAVYFDLFLEEDSENAIYESPVIPLGGELKNIRLNRKLDMGTYNCVLIYHLVDEEQNSISTASFTVKIIVEG